MERRGILLLDPDLASGLEAGQRLEAEVRCTAPVRTLRRASWRDPAQVWRAGEDLLLVLDGFALRRVVHRDHRSVEVIGPGLPLMRPAVDPAQRAEPVVRTLGDVRVAALDARFAQHAGRWPQIHLNLLSRMAERADLLADALALMHVPRLTERLHLTLWRLAERWGRVSPRGVWLPFRLTQQDLADLTGARRPSVTAALRSLREAGLVDARDRQRLFVRPPEALTSFQSVR